VYRITGLGAALLREDRQALPECNMGRIQDLGLLLGRATVHRDDRDGIRGELGRGCIRIRAPLCVRLRLAGSGRKPPPEPREPHTAGPAGRLHREALGRRVLAARPIEYTSNRFDSLIKTVIQYDEQMILIETFILTGLTV
jgi:hypothetical protein